jgi:4-amino-4-deoxy-L-arabinose transferase-like glycosyltransferase
VLFAQNLDKAFIGHHDWNSAWHGIAARNMDRYGLLQVRFASVMNAEKTEPSNFVYFTHYPPLVPIFVYLSIETFGIHNWSIRLVPVIFTLLTVAIIYLIADKFFDKRIALLSSIISSIFPITLYFSRIPTHDIIAMPFVLASIFFYFNFFKTPTKKNVFILFTTLLLSHLTHWSGYYTTPLFFIHFLLFAKQKNKILVSVLFPAFSIIMFSLHMIHLIWLTGDPFGGGLISILKNRLNLAQKPLGYSEINYIKLESRLLAIYFTRPALILALIGLYACLKNILKNKITEKESIIIMLATIGVLPIALFRNLAYVHDFIVISNLPFFAIGAAYGTFKLFKKLKLSSGFWGFSVVLALLMVIYFERISFTRALLEGNAFEPGRKLGEIINKRTKDDQKTLILSEDFKTHFDVQTSYYADRPLEYHQVPLEELEQDLYSKKYQMVVAFPKRDTPREYTEVLQRYYKKTKIDEFEVFEHR